VGAFSWIMLAFCVYAPGPGVLSIFFSDGLTELIVQDGPRSLGSLVYYPGPGMLVVVLSSGEWYTSSFSFSHAVSGHDYFIGE